MLTKKMSISVGIFAVFAVALLMGGVHANKANSMHPASGMFSHMDAESDTESEMVSWVCVKDNNDVVMVSVAKSLARQRDGHWYLPGCN